MVTIPSRSSNKPYLPSRGSVNESDYLRNTPEQDLPRNPEVGTTSCVAQCKAEQRGFSPASTFRMHLTK